MNGKSSEKFNQLRDKLLKILSFVEAKIDFPEEDLPDENIKQIKKDTTEVLNKIKKILDDQKVGEIIREGFKIAIVGPTNAGKSSLLNNLSNRDVAIVSEIAGTTRDVNETHLNIINRRLENYKNFKGQFRIPFKFAYPPHTPFNKDFTNGIKRVDKLALLNVIYKINLSTKNISVLNFDIVSEFPNCGVAKKSYE